MLTTGGRILNVAIAFSVYLHVKSNVIILGWKSLEALGNKEMFLLAIFC